MDPDNYQRRLAALISADVAGYSRLMSDDEIATMRLMNLCRERVGALVAAASGRVVDFVGDNLLAEFPNTLSAVECAARIHEAARNINTDLPPARHLHFRIGIHIGDVMADGHGLYGDGVNIAARLEALAGPGSTCISDSVYKQIHGRQPYHFVDLGERRLKNISDRVHVYRVVDPAVDPHGSVEPAGPLFKDAPLPRPAKPSLAVLPFVNLSASPDQDHLALGLTLDIQTALVLIPGLFVISESTMINFRTTLSSIQEIGRQFGVSHILEGGVRRAGDRLRITARLVEAESGRQIWAERYDRRMGDLFEVQDEITREITTAMDVQLVSGISGQTISKALKNPKAIECYYKGYGAMSNSLRPDFHLGIEMFEEVIRLEPEVFIGYAVLAYTHVMCVIQNRTCDRDHSLAQAAAMAHRALELKDDTGLSELVIAMVHLLQNEPEKALHAAEQAVLARPSCDSSYAVKASVLNYLGRPAEAVELARFAIRLSPVYPAFFADILAAAYCGCRRFEEAIEAAEIGLESNPDDFDALVISAIAYAGLERMNQARHFARTIVGLKPGFSTHSFAHFYPYKDPGQLEQMTELLKKAGVP
ncbi:MAG: hypothetical protein C4519_05950 [Desulfobacteraceae bacterium]|nr:MAG: hypothetical protein C4519_05950 [Desulfobacteraceae bacterium]